jgi:hypothetical protein
MYAYKFTLSQKRILKFTACDAIVAAVYASVDNPNDTNGGVQPTSHIGSTTLPMVIA